MKIKLPFSFFAISLLCIFCENVSVQAQTSEQFLEQQQVKILGYFQGAAMHFRSVPSIQSASTQIVESNDFSISQANLLVQKNSTWGLSAMVNLEFTNNYSSNRGFGSFNLQEAFIRYDYSNQLSIKAGLFIPMFNSMYETYNRTPLLPYLFRPAMYEVQQQTLTGMFTLLPSRAMMQISGYVPIDNGKFDYALFLGNADEFIENAFKPIRPDYIASGQNASNYASLGGRIGVRTNTLKAGFSLVNDVSNRRSFYIDAAFKEERNFGDLARLRFGADFSWTIGRVTLSGEYIRSQSKLTQQQQDSLEFWSRQPDTQIGGSNFDAEAYFATVQADLTDELFAYGSIDSYKDNARAYYLGNAGQRGFSLGAGYRVADDLVVKIQYRTQHAGEFVSTDEQGAIVRSSTTDQFYLLGFSYSF